MNEVRFLATNAFLASDSSSLVRNTPSRVSTAARASAAADAFKRHKASCSFRLVSGAPRDCAPPPLSRARRLEPHRERARRAPQRPPRARAAASRPAQPRREALSRLKPRRRFSAASLAVARPGFVAVPTSPNATARRVDAFCAARFGVNLRVAHTQIARLRTDVDAFSRHVVFAFAKASRSITAIFASVSFSRRIASALNTAALSRSRRARPETRASLRAPFSSPRAPFSLAARARSIASDASRLSRGERRARARSASAVRRARSASRGAPGVIQHGLELRRQTRRRRGVEGTRCRRARARACPGARARGPPRLERRARRRSATRRSSAGGAATRGAFRTAGDEHVALGVVVYTANARAGRGCAVRRFGTRRSPKTAWRARMRGRREALYLGSSPERSAERARFHRECRECARSERGRARASRGARARDARNRCSVDQSGHPPRNTSFFPKLVFSRPRRTWPRSAFYFTRAAPSSPEDGGPPLTSARCTQGDVDARPLVRGAQARLGLFASAVSVVERLPVDGGRRAFRAAGGCVPRPPRADARRAGGGAAPRAGEPAGGDAPVPRAGGYPGKGRTKTRPRCRAPPSRQPPGRCGWARRRPRGGRRGVCRTCGGSTGTRRR